MLLNYDDIERTTTSSLQQEHRDDIEIEEISDYDSITGSFPSSTASSVSEYSLRPYLEIEEIDEGLIQFSRTSSSNSFLSYFTPSQPLPHPPLWRRNWVKWLLEQSGIIGRHTSATPKEDKPAPKADQLETFNILDKITETIPFDHHGYDGIKTIIIYCGRTIYSIRIQYTKHGKLEWTERIGENGGERFEILLDDPDECIVKVTGGYCTLLYGVCFLTFFSNRKTYGPFGLNRGTLEKQMRDYLTLFEYSGEKLVGFRGTTEVVSKKLSSIGFNFCSLFLSYEKYENTSIRSTTSLTHQAPDINQTITMGEWGYLKDGLDEIPFDHYGFDGIKKIIIYCGLVIDSITVQYKKYGELEWTKKVGGDGGHRCEIVLDDPDEYIMKVTGYTDLLDRVNSLTLFSNRKIYGPFGLYQGSLEEKLRHDFTSFGYSGAKLVGFKGTEGIVSKKLSSIGFNVCPLPQSYENKSIMSTTSVIDQVSNVNQVHHKIQQISVEPFGYSRDGTFFDHGEYDGIKTIFISHGRWINSLKVEYMKNGRRQIASKVGQKGKNAAKVVLDYPQEFLQKVTGHYLAELGFGGITSLTFHSNLKIYGPFGYEEGQALQVSGGKIVGFKGTTFEGRLHSIGFHLLPIESLLAPFCDSCESSRLTTSKVM